MNPASFQVSLLHLSADASVVRTASEPLDLGLITTPEVRALLDQFCHLDPVNNQESDPRILIAGPNEKLSIRTGLGRLFVYDARDTSVPFVELTADEIIDLLVASKPVASIHPELGPGRPASVKSPHRGIALAILAAGLLLNGYTLYSVFYIDSVNVQPSLTLLTEPAKIATMREDLAGNYATGRNSGDRGIILGRDGSVRFMEFGSQGNRYESTDQFRIGRDGQWVYLATADNGSIQVLNNTTLVYYRDTYRREN